jgi:cyclopropane-fatty-acyl-phospholipid synthase
VDFADLAHPIFDHPSRSFTAELWDGSVLPPRSKGPDGRIIFGSPAALAALFPPASERAIAEAFIGGDIELIGDTIGLLEAAALWEGPGHKIPFTGVISAWLKRVRGGRKEALAASRRGQLHSKSRDRNAIRHHYDVSNEFYRLFLDPAMVYSCGYFPSGEESLDSAQRKKLELICRKLNLREGERFLDIGCGWGALLFHAASQHGARALGVTLSENQISEGRRRLEELSIRNSVEIRAQDYRELTSERAFDKVASIGMMEHVGSDRLEEYFTTVFKLMRPGGLFLNHAIADIAAGVRTLRWLPKSRHGFMHRYIFPDSELIPIGLVTEAAERAGFEVRDLESLREHYAETLAHWLVRLEHRFEEAVSMVGRRRARAWRLYLASSSVGFRIGRIGVYQLLLAKRPPDGRVSAVPRYRARWYEGLLQGEVAPNLEQPGAYAATEADEPQPASSATLRSGVDHDFLSGKPSA